MPVQVDMIGWKGNPITSYDFAPAASEHGAPFWDFHRADLHNALLNRARELGATFYTKARVVDVETSAEAYATVVLATGERLDADLVVGADGIHSRCREILLGGPSPPVATGDLAYRVLLNTESMEQDPDLAPMLQNHHVRYWMGPGAHAVSYVLRNGKQINVVLLVPDDMPAGASTVDGNVAELQALYQDWDPRISELLKYCQSVQKWRLCYRPGLETTWYNTSGTFTLLGDAVHATLPYLASGAGMALEDGAVLGHAFSRVRGRSPEAKRLALSVYEKCRRYRTESIVDRGNHQQYLYHINDGEEQKARDAPFKAFEEVERVVQQTGSVRNVVLPEGLQAGSDPLAWRRFGVGECLLSYDCAADVARNWPSAFSSEL